MLSEPQTVTARLRAEVAAHRLEFDPTQFDAAGRLDSLGDDLRRRPAGVLRRLRFRPEPQRGLYLWGGVGRGKTLLMDLFCASLQPAAHGPGEFAGATADLAPGAASFRERGVVRSHFYHFMRDVHAELASIKQRADPLQQVAQRLARNIRVICLDEFFVADIADAMILAGLFDGLFRRGVTLVATSNLAPQDLYKDGLQRQRFLPAIALIDKHVDVLHLDGGVDYRLRQLERAPTYLDSTLAATPPALQQRFDALAGRTLVGSVLATGPTTLLIEGRPLHAVNSCSGTAWFEFSELCDGPRSQNDYIELGRLFHTVFIANIPCFDRGNEDAARRFIMLIDELYDRGVKVVVSAAAAPAALYHGDRLRFEFERAASRLIEMQSQQYLAGQHRP